MSTATDIRTLAERAARDHTKVRFFAYGWRRENMAVHTVGPDGFSYYPFDKAPMQRYLSFVLFTKVEGFEPV